MVGWGADEVKRKFRKETLIIAQSIGFENPKIGKFQKKVLFL